MRLRIIVPLLLLILLFGCATRHKVSDASFGRYISGFTSGKVHLDEEIQIELAQPLLDSMRIDRNDTLSLQKAFRISPAIKGRYYWKNDKMIAFKPESNFRQGRQYQVSLQLSRLAKVPSAFHHFHFNFETEPLKFDISYEGFVSGYGDEPEWPSYAISLHANTTIDTTVLKKCFKVTQEGRQLSLRCIDFGERSYRIYIDSVARKQSRSKLEIDWSTQPIKGKTSGNKEVVVPGMGEFTVTKMEVADDGDQVLNITFTDPLESTQNFDAFVLVEGKPKVQFSASGNQLKVFFAERQEGGRKVTIQQGLLNAYRYKMDSTVTGSVVFEGPKPALRMNGKGCILPNSQGLLFPFESIGLHTVDVRVVKIKEQNIHQFLQVNELSGDDGLTRVGRIILEKTLRIVADTVTPQNQWTTHILDLGKLISPEPGALYRVYIRFQKSYTYLACAAETNSEDNDDEYIYQVAATEDSTWNEYGWHGEGFNGYDTWRYNDDDPCDNSYYRGGAISKNILASDIGVIYRELPGKKGKVITTDLLTGKALPNTEVALFAYTREKIAEGRTDESGFLDLSLREKPFLLVASKGKQRAYLKLTNSNALSTARFDVDGADQAGGLKGFLYAERGVWRPGDSVMLHFVLNDQARPLPADHPVTFELSDPNGRVLFKRITKQHQGHIYPLYFATATNAPMGSYTAKVSVGNAVFYKNILLEAIVPNRMKLQSNIDGRLLADADSLLTLKVTWLNGAVGKGLKAQSTASLRPQANYFTQYKSYAFIAPYNEQYHASFELKEALTDQEGMAVFRRQAIQPGTAPGILKGDYVWKAYEQGGGFSIDKSTATISLYGSYVGLEVPEGNGYSGSLDYQKNYSFRYVLLNKDQQKVRNHRVQLKIYEQQYQHWYEIDRRDIASFRSHNAKVCVRDTQMTVADGAGSFVFGNIGKHYGRYLIVLKDLDSGHETGAIVIFDDPYWDRYGDENSDQESIVQLSTSKKTYQVGDNIQLNVPCPAGASVLVTVSSDATVLSQFWVPVKAAGQPIVFSATKEMAPGIYIHATVLQAHHYTKNGGPIRQYGILPVMVEDADARLIPLISMKEEVKPETDNTLSISEQTGKEMYYSLVLVDEGLLDLTHFKTPDIWTVMNSRQSLKIKTWDLYNQVIGAYAGKIENVLTIGGDGGYDETEETKANRFKPAVVNLGLFHLAKGAKQIHHFTLPNYCGSMKAFVVAYEHGRSGSASKTFAVRKPLMLLTAAPRSMSASEAYILPITVFNMEHSDKKVTVSLKASGIEGIQDVASQVISIPKESDAVVNFSLKLPAAVGILHLSVLAGDGKNTATEKLEIQVKPTYPVINHPNWQALDAGASYTFDQTPKGIKGAYSNSFTVGDLPIKDLESRLSYLISYPHGCVEQTTSSAFAQLMMSDLLDLKTEDAEKVAEHVRSVIRRLGQYQTFKGGFSYWPYHYEEHNYASVYVLHFLLAAQRKGFEVPQYMIDNALKYQATQAADFEATEAKGYYYEEQESSQAYRLYLLALMGKPDITAMNKLMEGNFKSDVPKALLARAYTLSGRLDAAGRLYSQVNINWKKYTESTGMYDFLTEKSMMLLGLAKNGNTISQQQLADEVLNRLQSGWNGTLATSLALVSLSEHYGGMQKGKASFSLNNKTTVLNRHFTQVKPLAMPASATIANNGQKKLYVTFNERYSSPDQAAKLVNNGMKFLVTYLDTDGKPLPVAAMQHGTNFIAKIEVENTSGLRLDQVALEYHIANGWQILINRYVDEGGFRSASATFVNSTDDQVSYYFDLAIQEKKIFYLRLNASYKGHFYLPLAQCYPMYNERYKAQVAGAWVDVR